MRIPSTGSLMLDTALAFIFFVAGVFIWLKRENRIGIVIAVVAIYWAYSIYQRVA